jgi:hydrogenase nickel incorporation protein HypA/HybF
MQQALDALLDRLRAVGGSRILEVRMNVGAMSGVVPDALRFAFEALTPGTPAEGAALALERIPVVCYCAGCEREVELDGYAYLCPGCGSSELDIRRGTEFEVISMEVE